jgi:hypothetical protein
MPTMTRTALMSLVIAAAACKREPPTAAGPPYTPATANALKAHAGDCEIRPGPDGGETRACRGRQATMRIELDRQRRLRELEMMVLASTGVWEAWPLFQNVLPAVAGQAVLDATRKKLHGNPADDVVDRVRIVTAIDGQRYTVKLTWGQR